MTPRRALVRTALALAIVAPPVAAPAHGQTWGVRATADAGARTFTAADSFEAVLGSAVGPVFGGGVEIVLPHGIFAGARLSWFRQTGQRVFVFEGETYELGIDNTVRVLPIEVTGGYRFSAGRRLAPYAGGGIGWHRYDETSEFATASDNVSATFRGYHAVAGAEYRVSRWLGAGGEFQWTTVPDALGQDASGVSAAFGETDLGGLSFRLRVTVGR